jgi:membrane-associated protein
MRSTLLASIGINPDNLIRSVGAFGLFAVVFAESGLMFGFFLPGDSLLFVAGLLAATTDLLPPVPVVMIGCFVAAVAGDQAGYWIGHHAGPRIFNRPDSRLFKKEFVERSQAFFDEKGSKAIIIARFVPIVRAFAPVIAGVSKMPYRTYLLFDVIGGFLWACGVTALGAELGSKFPKIGDYLDIAIPVIVAISLIPVGLEYLKHRREKAERLAEETV